MTPEKQYRVVELLADEWGRWQDEDTFPFKPDHCINGTRVAVETLRVLGIEARPVSVEMFIANVFAVDLISKGQPPELWPEHAWSVGVAAGHLPKPGHWNGHLVCEGPWGTLDISARQFHRPGRIEIPAPIVWREVMPETGPLLQVDNRGQLARYERWPENNGWRSAPGWKPTPDNLRAQEGLVMRMAAAVRR